MKTERTMPDAPEVWVEALDVEAAAAFAADWRDLARRALEANIFGEPGCLLPAARHLAGAAAPLFLLAWEKGPAGPRGTLLAVCPVAKPSIRQFWRPLRVWTHEQAALGAPLLDKARAGAALRALLDAVASAWPKRSGLMISMIGLEGPTAALLAARAHGDVAYHVDGPPAGLKIFDRGARAVLPRPEKPAASLRGAMTGRRFYKLNRNRRRLAEQGAVGVATAADPGALSEAAEQFLRLEAKGWKGRAGTALLVSLKTAAFARDLLRDFAGHGQCRILRLTVGDAIAAMVIVLIAADRAFVWKIAYDESFAACSPGAQLILDLTRAHLADDAIALTDSCAVPDHPMIDHIWRDRMPIGDIALALPGRPLAAFNRAMAAETLVRSLMRAAKKAVRRLRGGKQS